MDQRRAAIKSLFPLLPLEVGPRGGDQKTGKEKRHGRELTVSWGFQINRDRRELCHHWFGVCSSIPVAWDGGLEHGIGHVCGHTPARDCRTFLYSGRGQGFKETRRALSLKAKALGSPSQGSLRRLHGHMKKGEELIRERDGRPFASLNFKGLPKLHSISHDP